MILHLRKWIERAKFIALFLLLTFLLYQMLTTVSAWLEPTRKYREPEGSAVKVFRQDTGTMDADGMAERLKLFYWYGE